MKGRREKGREERKEVMESKALFPDTFFFFFFYLWGMCVCVCILGQNVKCSFCGTLTQNNEEKNTLRVRGPLIQMIKDEIAILLSCQYV